MGNTCLLMLLLNDMIDGWQLSSHAMQLQVMQCCS